MPKTFDSDPLAYPHLPGVLETLQDVLDEQLLGRACTATPIAGESPLLEYMGDDCDSYAWARIVGTFPSFYSFPNPDERPAPAVLLATQIELGLMHTVELPDNGEVVEPEVQQEQARRAAAEMRAMLIALCRYAGDDIPIQIGTYVPLGPAGGVLGGIWSATLGEAP